MIKIENPIAGQSLYDVRYLKLDQTTPQTVAGTPTFPLLITPKIYPSADSTTAFQINKADGVTNILNVDSTNGRVGIGTNVPSTILELSPDLTATTLNGINIRPSLPTAATAGKSMFYEFSHNNGVTLGYLSQNYGTGGLNVYDMFLWNAQNAPIRFGTNGTERLTILSGGNVGIRTTAPSGTFDVHGAGTTTGITFQTADSGGNAKFTVLDNGNISVVGSQTFTVAASGIILKQGANGKCGTVVLNGVTPVTVSNTSVAITDTIIFSLNTVGGTVGAYPVIQTITAATGFTVLGTALDTSTYNYVIISNAA